jgi:hypothetical protein
VKVYEINNVDIYGTIMTLPMKNKKRQKQPDMDARGRKTNQKTKFSDKNI